MEDNSLTIPSNLPPPPSSISTPLNENDNNEQVLKCGKNDSEAKKEKAENPPLFSFSFHSHNNPLQHNEVEDYQALVKRFEIDEHASFRPPPELIKEELASTAVLTPAATNTFQGLVRHFNIDQYSTFNAKALSGEKTPSVMMANQTPSSATTPAYSFPSYAASFGATPNVSVIASALSSKISGSASMFSPSSFLFSPPSENASRPLSHLPPAVHASNSASKMSAPRFSFSFATQRPAGVHRSAPSVYKNHPTFTLKKHRSATLVKPSSSKLLKLKLIQKLAKTQSRLFPAKRLPFNLKWKTLSPHSRRRKPTPTPTQRPLQPRQQHYRPQQMRQASSIKLIPHSISPLKRVQHHVSPFKQPYSPTMATKPPKPQKTAYFQNLKISNNPVTYNPQMRQRQPHQHQQYFPQQRTPQLMRLSPNKQLRLVTSFPKKVIEVL